MTNAYLYAGSTLMLAGLIDKANRYTHIFSHNALGCNLCRDRFRAELDKWQRRQATNDWLSRVDIPYWARG